jgi:hypothetical protein
LIFNETSVERAAIRHSRESLFSLVSREYINANIYIYIKEGTKVKTTSSQRRAAKDTNVNKPFWHYRQIFFFFFFSYRVSNAKLCAVTKR